MSLNEALVCFLVSCHTVNKCPFHSYLVLLFFGDAIQPSHPLRPLLLLPSVFPSIRVFSSELALHTRWPQYWSFSFCISPFNEYSGLISWLGLTGFISLLSKGLSSVFSSPQFESINSSMPSLLYSPTLTSTHDSWKNHSFDYIDICWQNDISAF